ncbi:MAG: serine hydrolase domain-containing protein [Blastomonas sp.]
MSVANPAELGFSAERLSRIDAHLKGKYLDTGRFPHAALLIGRGEEIAHLSVQGEAAPGTPLQEDAIFRIASMTKPVTSIAIMQLVEQGLIALSDPVARYIPEFADLGVFVSGGGNQPFMTRSPARPMQVIDLLRHTSGLTYSFQERSPVDAAYRKTDLEHWNNNDNGEFLAKLASIPLEFDPGSSWNYSVSCDVLGIIISRLSGLTLGDYFRQRIFAPIGMEDTCFHVPADKAHRLPIAYAFDPKDRKKPVDAAGSESQWAKGFRFESGGGGLASTLKDYHLFCRMLLNQGSLDGERIIARKTLDLMTANHLPGGGDLTRHSKSLFSEAENAGVGFGLGFATTMQPELTMVPGSSGDIYWGGMYSTAFFVDPVEEIIMVFMTQLMPSSAYPVRREIRTMLYAALED